MATAIASKNHIKIGNEIFECVRVWKKSSHREEKVQRKKEKENGKCSSRRTGGDSLFYSFEW